MNDKITEKPFLTEAEAIEELRKTVADEGLHPARSAISVGGLRDLLGRIKTTDFGLGQVKAAISNMLRKYTMNNPGGDGLPMPFIWRNLISGDSRITSKMVEDGLAELLKEGKIRSRQEGITYYLWSGALPIEGEEHTPLETEK